MKRLKAFIADYVPWEIIAAFIIIYAVLFGAAYLLRKHDQSIWETALETYSSTMDKQQHQLIDSQNLESLGVIQFMNHGTNLLNIRIQRVEISSNGGPFISKLFLMTQWRDKWLKTELETLKGTEGRE